MVEYENTNATRKKEASLYGAHADHSKLVSPKVEAPIIGATVTESG
jgi:hypothetical protein